MKRTNKVDDFFEKQPDLLFLKDLKSPLHPELSNHFKERTAKEGEISAKGLYLVPEFDDKDGLLETAYDDFKCFLNAYCLGGNLFPVRTRYCSTDVFEQYIIEITENGATISAGDTEGIRRGIYYIEDELKAREAAFLPEGTIKRTPHIKRRITRGFFSPTNRAPKFGDELSDDIDYYDDNYLNRLAHDGSNGIWIYTRYSDLVKTDIIPEYGNGGEKRIEKLRKVCKKCARYGIGVYVFAIEPEAPTKPEIYEAHPELLGGPSGNSEFRAANGIKTFCTHTEAGRAYCIEATKKLCEAAPEIAGIMSITAGERVTSCAAEAGNVCPHCGHIPRGESLAQTIDCIKEGIRQSGKDIEYISWTYGHRMWYREEDITDYVKYAPDDIMLMQNFDDMAYEQQLGKVRQGVDYWLSYPGPSDLFKNTALAAQKFNKHMFAKMQVCCSHEIATVPYVPVPGIIFDKFKGAHELGVEGVLECWYFGNYPSIMSKAAGELSFWEDFDDKKGFLTRLASIYGGQSNAENLVSAWYLFEEGYRKYPLNVMFSYYGPMHDGVCWQLHLKPKNFSLSRSWLLMDRPDGDRIYEALACGHTLDEAITLTDEMATKFEEGLKVVEGTLVPQEHESVINAMAILFRSGNNILKFYKKREQIGFSEGDAKVLLSEMEALVYDEIKNSEKMIELCYADNRLGYHSEAEGYKYFPEKIAYRIEKLKELLSTEFVEVKERIKKGLEPLPYFLSGSDDEVSKPLIKGNIENSEKHYLDDNSSFFSASYDDENLYIKVSGINKNFIISPEFIPMHPYPPICVSADGKATFNYEAKFYYNYFGERLESEIAKWKAEKTDDGILVSVSRKDIEWDGEKPIRLCISTFEGAKWLRDEMAIYSLGKSTVSPGDFGWFIPEK